MALKGSLSCSDRLIPPYSTALFRLIRFTLKLLRCAQEPHGSSSMAAGIDQPKPFQMKQIIAQSTVSRRGIDLSADIGKLAFPPTSDGLKNLALAFSKIMCDAKRRNIAARQEPNAYCSGDLQELRFRVAGPEAQFNNLLRAASPASAPPTP